MKFGKTIKIFLLEGDPNGRMTYELSNWTWKAYKIPRIKIKDCTDRKDLQSTGIYLLFGKDEEGKDQVYIGEAESILKRLNQQLTQKEFWNETITMYFSASCLAFILFYFKPSNKLFVLPGWSLSIKHMTSMEKYFSKRQ